MTILQVIENRQQKFIICLFAFSAFGTSLNHFITSNTIGNWKGMTLCFIVILTGWFIVSTLIAWTFADMKHIIKQDEKSCNNVYSSLPGRVPTFSDWQNSIFPGFWVNFQVIFSLFFKCNYQAVLNINVQPYWVSFEQKLNHFNYTPN